MTPPLSDLPKPHYPFVTRMLLELWREGELPQITTIGVDPSFGHVGRIVYRDGSVRMFRASSLGVNRQGPADIARDKADTRLFLAALGYAVPPGKLFASTRHHRLLGRQFGAEAAAQIGSPEQAVAWVENNVGYPCYIKPNSSSQGRGVACCRSRAELEMTLEAYERERVTLFLIEAAVPWPDYRVLVWRGQIVAAYERRPPGIVGDGISSVEALVALWRNKDQGAKAVADDARLDARLEAQGKTRASVLAVGEFLRLGDIANLSAGGSAIDVSERIGQGWKQLCIQAVDKMGLTFCGVDLACADIADSSAPYAIFELNSAPGLEHYAALGPVQLARVRELYREIFCVSV